MSLIDKKMYRKKMSEDYIVICISELYHGYKIKLSSNIFSSKTSIFCSLENHC